MAVIGGCQCVWVTLRQEIPRSNWDWRRNGNVRDVTTVGIKWGCPPTLYGWGV